MFVIKIDNPEIQNRIKEYAKQHKIALEDNHTQENIDWLKETLLYGNKNEK